jgi:hypothetical protein
MQFDVVAIVSLIIGIGTIVSTSALGVRWLVKHYFEEIKHELKPNSGQSIKDQVNRMENDILLLKDQNVDGNDYHKRLDQKIDSLTEMFITYISSRTSRD